MSRCSCAVGAAKVHAYLSPSFSSHTRAAVLTVNNREILYVPPAPGGLGLNVGLSITDDTTGQLKSLSLCFLKEFAFFALEDQLICPPAVPGGEAIVCDFNPSQTDPNGGCLTLTAAAGAPIAVFQELASGIRYNNLAPFHGPIPGPRTMRFSAVNIANQPSLPPPESGQFVIQVTSDPAVTATCPTLVTQLSGRYILASNLPMQVEPAIATPQVPAGAAIVEAHVRINSGCIPGEDSLAIASYLAPPPGFVGEFSALTCTLTITSPVTQTPLAWRRVLERVVLNNAVVDAGTPGAATVGTRSYTIVIATDNCNSVYQYGMITLVRDSTNQPPQCACAPFIQGPSNLTVLFTPSNPGELFFFPVEPQATTGAPPADNPRAVSLVGLIGTPAQQTAAGCPTNPSPENVLVVGMEARIFEGCRSGVTAVDTVPEDQLDFVREGGPSSVQGLLSFYDFFRCKLFVRTAPGTSVTLATMMAAMQRSAFAANFGRAQTPGVRNIQVTFTDTNLCTSNLDAVHFGIDVQPGGGGASGVVPGRNGTLIQVTPRANSTGGGGGSNPISGGGSDPVTSGATSPVLGFTAVLAAGLAAFLRRL